MVTLAPADAGELPGDTIDRTGALYEKRSATVPTNDTIDTAVDWPIPYPGAPAHKRLLPDVHDTVEQAVLPSRIEGVKFSAPKLYPEMVSSLPALVGMFILSIRVRRGPSNENAPVLVPMAAARVRAIVVFVPVPGGLVQMTELSVLHTVV
jgi:hypothetical protein